MTRRAGASAPLRPTATAALGTTTPGARPWAPPRRPATPPGSTTPVAGPSAARPRRARWRSREGSGPRGGIRSGPGAAAGDRYGSNEQMFGADEQVPYGGQSD